MALSGLRKRAGVHISSAIPLLQAAAVPGCSLPNALSAQPLAHALAPQPHSIPGKMDLALMWHSSACPASTPLGITEARIHFRYKQWAESIQCKHHILKHLTSALLPVPNAPESIWPGLSAKRKNNNNNNNKAPASLRVLRTP